ncbi:MAG: FAD:protein FMN transferase [Solirubrobacteraceae bacterium]
MPTPARTRQVHVEHVMGTAVSIDLRTGAGAAGMIEETVRWLHHVDATFSTYKPDSVISRIGRGDIAPADCDADVRFVYHQCECLRGQTHGYFDAWASGSFDPSAYVKGWSLQRAADRMTYVGIEDFCLTAGGDVVTRGSSVDGVPWRVGIQHPLDRAATAARIEASDLAVATSGAYERGDHVLDPVTGRVPRGVLSVTVAGPDLGTADALATAAYAMGADGPSWTLGLGCYEAMTILSDETVLCTPGFDELLA